MVGCFIVVDKSFVSCGVVVILFENFGNCFLIWYFVGCEDEIEDWFGVESINVRL